MLRALIAAVVLLAGTGARAGTETGVRPEDGLAYWRLAERGVHLELVQRLPDQTRAFFQARGFPPGAAERLAQGCVFQTIFRNEAAPGGGAVAYDLAEWRVHGPGGARGLALMEGWDAGFAEAGVPEPARIAFRWAFLPTRQRFEPGDYNWGMTAFGLAPGTHFDLELAWQRAGVRETARIADLHCAPDVRALPRPEG